MKRYKVEVRIVKAFFIEADAYDEEDAAEIVDKMDVEEIERLGDFIDSGLPEIIYIERISNGD